MIFLLLVGGIYLYKTYALYEEKKEFNVLKGKVPDFRKIYTEELLNGADPVLKEGLIPVEIGNDGRVTKANTQNEWYSYAEKRWANAVILSDESIEYKDYEEIPESNIESYFVWIPKYSYQLWDLGEYNGLTTLDTTKPHTIPIKFGLENTSDSVEGECTTPMTSGASGNCQIGDYMTPPAFISMGTNGLWVGKFETGYKGATSSSTAQVNANDASKVQIKPNVYSWRNINVSNAFYTSYNYKRELDSHMMKNTEWGTVAYLQHSQYGSATKVRINNNSAFVTGYAGTEEPTVGHNQGTSIVENRIESKSPKTDGTYTINYLNPNSQVASTTGNYTGIYDMSGGAFEITMSAKSEQFIQGLNLDSSISNKYYEVYNYPFTHYYGYQYRILGDATGELGPFQSTKDPDGRSIPKSSWYNEQTLMFLNNYVFETRGGDWMYGVESGIFSQGYISPSSDSRHSFRIVLAI